jgi:hypothetical protein
MRSFSKFFCWRRSPSCDTTKRNIVRRHDLVLTKSEYFMLCSVLMSQLSVLIQCCTLTREIRHSKHMSQNRFQERAYLSSFLSCYAEGSGFILISLYILTSKNIILCKRGWIFWNVCQISIGRGGNIRITFMKKLRADWKYGNAGYRPVQRVLFYHLPFKTPKTTL